MQLELQKKNFQGMVVIENETEETEEIDMIVEAIVIEMTEATVMIGEVEVDKDHITLSGD